MGLGLKCEGGWLHWVDEQGQKLALSEQMGAEQRALEAERKMQEGLAELERLRGGG